MANEKNVKAGLPPETVNLSPETEAALAAQAKILTETFAKQMADNQTAMQVKLDEALAARAERRESGDEVIDADDTKRIPPKYMRLRTYKKSPIVKSQITNEEKQLDNGQIIIVGQTISFETLDGQEGQLRYGSTSREDYLNLPMEQYDLVDAIDETGASRVDKGVIIHDNGYVNRNDDKSHMILNEDNGQFSAGGRRVSQLTKADMREYTLVVNGKKEVLTENMIGR